MKFSFSARSKVFAAATTPRPRCTTWPYTFWFDRNSFSMGVVVLLMLKHRVARLRLRYGAAEGTVTSRADQPHRNIARQLFKLIGCTGKAVRRDLSSLARLAYEAEMVMLLLRRVAWDLYECLA